MARPLIRNTVLSAVLPPVEPVGSIKLWVALGRRFK
jgi:hypothetical protein